MAQYVLIAASAPRIQVRAQRRSQLDVARWNEHLVLLPALPTGVAASRPRCSTSPKMPTPSSFVQRAVQSPATGFRFGGFAAHHQDYEASLDHFASMRTGLDYMNILTSPLDDKKQSMLLFPTPNTADFNVSFKLHAPLNTTIEARCQGGKLDHLNVDPPSRRADITVMNCAN